MGKKKSKKIRVAFRKNRQKKPRAQNLTQQSLDAGLDDSDLRSEERISGKGSITRYRTVIGVEQETDNGTQVLLDVDESKCQPGRVIRSIGLHSIVESEDGTQYECTVRRLLRTMARDSRSVVVAGDSVLFQPESGDDYQGVIERVNPRRSVLSRGSKRREHIIVANVDQVLIVASAADPHLKPGLIDRLLISGEKGGVKSLICINKADLIDPVEFQPIIGLYSQLGYEVVLASTVNLAGIDRLKTLLARHQTVLCGQSGVGKSTLLNQLIPGLKLRTGEVSTESRKGKHTTRSTELMKLPSGGHVVDTPGIRQLNLWNVIPEEVEGFFVEFRPFVTKCKFPDCTHTHEIACGILDAVEHGFISRLRYESYQRIFSGQDDASLKQSHKPKPEG